MSFFTFETTKGRILRILRDDGTLGGTPEDVLQDLERVERAAEGLGLQLNRSKSEVICGDSATRDSFWL